MSFISQPHNRRHRHRRRRRWHNSMFANLRLFLSLHLFRLLFLICDVIFSTNSIHHHHQDYLMTIQKHPLKSTFCKLRLLCRSLAGNNVYCLTVTAPIGDIKVKFIQGKLNFEFVIVFTSLPFFRNNNNNPKKNFFFSWWFFFLLLFKFASTHHLIHPHNNHTLPFNGVLHATHRKNVPLLLAHEFIRVKRHHHGWWKD